MFIKRGSAVLMEKVTVEDWRNQVVASALDQEEAMEALPFNLDTENFLYVRARAVSSGEKWGPNGNGDFFPKAELEKSYRTFIGRGIYLDHQSDLVENAVGIILDAVWHPKEEYVECLLAIDKQANNDVARKIENKIVDSVSMGAMVAECTCSICGEMATSEDEYCEHLANYMGRELRGKKVYAVNEGINFYELSLVSVPAEANAKILSRVAGQKTDFRSFIKNNDYREFVRKEGEQEVKKKADDILNIEAEPPEEKIAPPKVEPPKAGPPVPPGKKELEAGPLNIDKLVNRKVDQEVEKMVADKVRQVLDQEKIEKKIDQALGGDITTDVKERVQEKVPGAAAAPTPPAAPVDELPKDEPPKDEAPKIDEEKEKSEASLKGKIARVIKGVFGDKSEDEDDKSDDDIGDDKKLPFLDDIKDDKGDKDKEPGEAKGVELGDGYSVKSKKVGPDTKLVELYDRGKALGVYTESAEGDAADVDAVSFYRTKFELDKITGTKAPDLKPKGPGLGLEKDEPKTEIPKGMIEKEVEQVKSSLEIKYVPGSKSDFSDSFFLAKKGRLRTVISAARLLSEDTRKRILAKELKTEVGKSTVTEKEYDITKGKTDGEMTVGTDPNQPSDVVDRSSDTSKTEVAKGTVTSKEYDITKGKVDNEVKLGEEPEQPEDIINKYGKLSKGSITMLAKLWKSKIRVVAKRVTKEAKVAGTGNYAREEVAPTATESPRRDGEYWAKEKVDVSPVAPGGSRGAEMKKYFGTYNTQTLSEGGEQQRALKIAKIQIKILKAKLTKVEHATTQAAKDALIKDIIATEEELGLISASEEDTMRLHQDEGMDINDANLKSYDIAKENEVESLNTLDVDALQKVKGMIERTGNKIVPEIEKKATHVPVLYREENLTTEEDELSRIWNL